eukprot:1180487-Prorocentrum_minimum.AAC.3
MNRPGSRCTRSARFHRISSALGGCGGHCICPPCEFEVSGGEFELPGCKVELSGCEFKFPGCEVEASGGDFELPGREFEVSGCECELLGCEVEVSGGEFELPGGALGAARARPRTRCAPPAERPRACPRTLQSTPVAEGPPPYGTAARRGTAESAVRDSPRIPGPGAGGQRPGPARREEAGRAPAPPRAAPRAPWKLKGLNGESPAAQTPSAPTPAPTRDEAASGA